MDACIPSLEQLEMVLWLRSQGQGTAAEIARALATSQNSIEKRLGHLEQIGIVLNEGGASVYCPTPALALLVDRLAVEYSERRLQVISHLYGRPPTNSVQAFSDAFSLRPKQNPSPEDA